MKNKMIIIAIILILIAGSFVFYLYNRESSPSSYKKIAINIEGYRHDLSDAPIKIYSQEGNEWRKISWKLPLTDVGTRTGYYLDGKYYYSSWNDVNSCDKIGNQTFALVEYKKISEKLSPNKDINGNSQLMPVFETVPLKGKVKIEFEYYTSPDCKGQKNNFSEEYLAG